jgi:hypothetical protein
MLGDIRFGPSLAVIVVFAILERKNPFSIVSGIVLLLREFGTGPPQFSIR